MSDVTTHGTPVAVANDVMLFFEDDDKHTTEQVVFLDGGWAKFDYEGQTHIVPREEIKAVVTEVR